MACVGLPPCVWAHQREPQLPLTLHLSPSSLCAESNVTAVGVGGEVGVAVVSALQHEIMPCDTGHTSREMEVMVVFVPL